jgi:hypothetical protein
MHRSSMVFQKESRETADSNTRSCSYPNRTGDKKSFSTYKLRTTTPRRSHTQATPFLLGNPHRRVSGHSALPLAGHASPSLNPTRDYSTNLFLPSCRISFCLSTRLTTLLLFTPWHLIGGPLASLHPRIAQPCPRVRDVQFLQTSTAASQLTEHRSVPTHHITMNHTPFRGLILRPSHSFPAPSPKRTKSLYQK